jgi:hypothetical protein
MKSFHKIVSEVAEPKAGDEKHFKDKHVVTKVDYPVDVEAQFTGGKIVKAPKRKADYDKGEDEIVYEETFIIPEEILATEKNAFHTAAANAHKSGAKHFAFGGKKYPVTMSKDAASTFAGKGSMKKEAMDPVGKEDGDIDNDGDKDKSDKYLHNRRKAIGKSIRKEETEELDEISRDLARRYIRKVADKTNTGELSTKEVMKRRPGVNLAGKKAYPGVAGEPKVRATESVEQIDELSKKTLTSYVKKAAGDAVTKAYKAGDVRDKDSGKNYMKALGRQIGISTATNKLTKEEAEQIDELDKKTLGSYIKKANINAMDHARKSGEHNNPDQPKNFSKAMDRMRGIKKATDKLVAKEEVDLDEAKLSASQRDRLDDLILNVYTTTHPEYDGNDTPQKYLKAIEKEFGATIAKQVDDGSYQMHFGRDNQSSGHDKLASRQWSSKFKGGPRVTAAGKMNKQDVGALKTRIKNDKKFGGLLKSVKLPEEVEQLDELSPNTLHSYIKKAAGNMAGNAAVAAAQASSSMRKSSPDVKRKIKNRMTGITGASGRLADKANMNEDAYEEIPMMMSQLEFICYAAEEIMDYLEMTPDPEEWYQNKLATAHQSMMSLYSYARGEMRMATRSSGSGYYDDMYGEEAEQIDEISQDKLRDYHAAAALDLKKKREKLDKGTLTSKDYKQGQNRVTGLNRSANKMEEVELEEDITKMSHGRLKWHMNSGVPHGSYTKDEMKKERDRRLKTDPMGYRSAKAGLNEVTQTAMKKTVSYIDPKGHSRTRDVPVKRIDKDEHGQEKIRESVEILDEAFKVGMVKLKDGGSVVLKKEDVDLLNKMFKDLSTSNRKKMQEVAMKDKAGFEEILSFAREAI